MKKILFLSSIIFIALSMFSCTKNEDSFHQDKVELTTIGCSTPTGTKTSLDIASHKMTWNEGDQIGVAPVGSEFPGYGQDPKKQHTGIAPYSIINETISSDGTSARFQGPSQNKSKAIIAVYPYKSPNAEPFTEIQKYSHHYSWANSKNIFFPVPSIQYYVEGKVQDGVIPMYAYCEDPLTDNLIFKYAASVINFKLKSTTRNLTLQKIIIDSNVDIAGDCYIDWEKLKAGKENTDISGIYLGEKQIAYLFQDEGEPVGKEPLDVNIIVAARPLANLTVSVVYKEGDVIRKALLRANSISISNGVIKKFGEVDLDYAETVADRLVTINEEESVRLTEITDYLKIKKQTDASYAVRKITFEDANTTYSEVVSSLVALKSYLGSSKELAIDMSGIDNSKFTSFDEEYFFRTCGYQASELNLTYIKFPASVTKIGQNAFRGYHTMKGTIDFNNVNTIDIIAFYQHTLYEGNHDYSVTIPATLTSIGYGNFVNSKRIEVAADNPNYESRYGVLFKKGGTVIWSIPQYQPYETLKFGFNDGEKEHEECEEGENGKIYKYCKINATGCMSTLLLKNMINLKKVIFADGFEPSGTIMSYSRNLNSIVFARMTCPKFNFGGLEEWPGMNVEDKNRKIYLPKELLEDRNENLKVQWEEWAKCLTTVNPNVNYSGFHGVWTIDYTYTLAELQGKSKITRLSPNEIEL